MLNYDVVGHEQVREALKAEEGSFVLCGPEGVGRTGILLEWVRRTGAEIILPLLSRQVARNTADRARFMPGLVVAINAEKAAEGSWGPLMGPIEEGLITVGAVGSHDHLRGLETRVRLLNVGYLSESGIIRILARDYPSLTPRPWLAKASKGTLANLTQLSATVAVFEAMNYALENHQIPRQVTTNPTSVLDCIHLACEAKFGVENLPWTPAALSAIDPKVAHQFMRLSHPPGSVHEARNLAHLFFEWSYA